MENIIDFSHKILQDHLTKDDVALDMTIGNGNDSLFLGNISKIVYGFDIQENACLKAKKQLKGFDNVRIINDSHENFDHYISEDIKGVIFNLGYLPGGDKSVHTDAITVLNTLKKVLRYLKKDGVCVIVFYPGHESGMEEVLIISDYLKELNQKEFDVLKYEFINQKNNPPFLIAIKKRI